MIKLVALYSFSFLSLALGTFAQQAGKTPADVQPVFTSLESITAFVPPEIALRTGDKLNPIAAQAATDAMHKHALGRSAQLRVRIKTLGTSKGAYGGGAFVPAFKLSARVDRVQIRGAGFPCEIWGYFSKEEAVPLSNLRVGSTVTVAGAIAKCALNERGILVLDLIESKIMPPSR